jgi:hypothetical protein
MHLLGVHVNVVRTVLELELGVFLDCLQIIADALNEEVLHQPVEAVNEIPAPLRRRVGGIKDGDLVLRCCMAWNISLQFSGQLVLLSLMCWDRVHCPVPCHGCMAQPIVCA